MVTEKILDAEADVADIMLDVFGPDITIAGSGPSEYGKNWREVHALVVDPRREIALLEIYRLFQASCILYLDSNPDKDMHFSVSFECNYRPKK